MPSGGTLAQSQSADQPSPFGIRLPVGFTVLPQHLRLDAFVETAPVLELYPNTRVSWEWAVGGRYYF